jgi:magnesium-transporting ATPase (P-type)
MLNMMRKYGVDIALKRKEHMPDDYIRFHFTSKRKRMSTILEHVGQTEYGYDKRVHIKGAAEIVLATCSHYLNQDGEKVELQDEMKSLIMLNKP